MVESSKRPNRRFIHVSTVWTEHPVVIGLFMRLFLAWFLPWLLDNERFISGVAYTDIDFHVFSDAAAYVQQGKSPYARTTYRYTPFLAALLAVLPSKESGRYLFCIADAICGWIILRYRHRRRRRQSLGATMEVVDDGDNNTGATTFLSPRLLDAVWWLYNPLAINICTRGSAESLVVLLPVLITVWIATAAQQQQKQLCLAAFLAGICHGVAIHAKLYPIIYTLSFMTAFVTASTRREISLGSSGGGQPPSILHAFFQMLLVWIRRLLAPAPILFGSTAVATFVGFTYAAVRFYGDDAWREGLLYHFSRVDHRHNYSMHWYWIYLARARDSVGSSSNGGGSITTANSSMMWTGRLLLVPQLILLAYTSLGIAPHNLSLALFVQTFLFVAHNKVITAQYFAWYLCLLPLCSDRLRMTRRVQTALLLLAASIMFWLGSAYCLEMQGMAVHRTVWVASMVFFMANVNLLGALLASSVTTKLRLGPDAVKKTE